YISAFQKNTSIADSRLDVLKNLNIPELKSILSFKILYAQQKNIDVSIEIPDVIDEVDAHMLIDICRIAGVLIDNAIEASEDAEKAVLRFLALKKEERIIFVFTNTYTEVPSLSKIFENGFTTKQGARGLGLYSVSQMIEANERLSLNTHIEDTFFVQELSVFL
ncbi:MAG: GHKL domain-containing protein, partial [Clostridiales bacterium]|nr:GHKL domain-containing protein [Clostridiales bacterium]